MTVEEEVKTIIQDARKQLKLECRGAVFEGDKTLDKKDLIKSQKPEEFTKKFIIEKILDLLGIHHEFTERSFVISKQGIRHVDYECSSKKGSFILEAKPVNEILNGSSPSCAVNQIKDIFVLKESRDFQFGVATDGLNWIIINPRSEIIAELTLEKDFSKLKSILVGKRDITTKKQEEISKRFFQWYNALMHGGSFKDNEGRQRKISPPESLVCNIRNVESESDKEEIAQTIVDRLIFIKFIQAKGLIKSDVLQYLAGIRQDALKWTLDQLFFSVLNTERDKRPQVDPKFDGIPYLNGSLFTKTKPEEQNQYYNVTAEILQKVIEFLDSFRFVSEIGEDASEAIDPEILGYIFERAMTSTDRKGTGAYYTPKYITRYISENTIYPFILEQARGFLRDDKNYKDSELPVSLDDLILNVSSRSLSEIYGDIVQRVRVLDPACGSGAFLLAASNVLLELYNRFEERLGLRNSPLALKKVILRNSIFGVDLNHEGIEIAKLRLWLWLAESYNPEGKIEPLPNIEYNIRAGNSLVGFVDISRFKEARLSLDDFMESEESLTEYLNERDRLINSYKEASGEVARELRVRIEAANEKVKMLLDIRLFQELMKKVGITSEEYRKLEPFHWGFEFHEIFANGKGGSGFDVVIGNPPYVRQEALGDLKKILKLYYEVYHGVADLYTYFFERGHNILRQNGQFGFISSNKFTKANYGKPLRSFLTHKNKLIEIIDFGDLTVFEGAATMPAIIITERKIVENQEFKFTSMKTLQFVSLNDEVEKISSKLDDGALIGDNWSLASGVEVGILKKMRQKGIPLGEYVDGKINYGVKTGFNQAFVIDLKTKEQLIKEDPKSSEIIKPFIVGDDVRKYEINIQDRFLIFTQRGINIDEYPAIKKHLEQHKEQLMPKPKDWNNNRNGKWNGRKPGPYEWYEIQDTVAYYKEFEKPKIIYPVIAREQRFAFDKSGAYSNDKTFIIPKDDLYLLSILNSKLTMNFARSTLSGLLGKEFEFRSVHLSNLSIRSISFSTPEAERSRFVSELKNLYSKGKFDRILELVETYLPKDTEGNFITSEEKSDVLHDLLAYLAEQMIELNKEKQSEIKGFLGWLEGYTNLKIDDMTLKSKVKEYYKHNWDEMKKILVRNKGKITEIDITQNEVLEKIKEEFEDSLSKLKPLLDRIKGTDWLIDQAVYRLYGLSKDEIKVVESQD